MPKKQVKKATQKAILSERKAKGVKGIILVDPAPSLADSRCPVFRVYKHPLKYRLKHMHKREKGKEFDEGAWDFIDYEIRHYDFDVTIDEEHASLKQLHDGSYVLDYHSSLLADTLEKKKTV